MVSLICGGLTAFAYTPLNSYPDTGQTSVNLFWAPFVCMYIFNMYAPFKW